MPEEAAIGDVEDFYIQLQRIDDSLLEELKAMSKAEREAIVSYIQTLEGV